ncbi:hypothetical protein ABZ759_24890 [Streptomyces sp. NPDC047860]
MFGRSFLRLLLVACWSVIAVTAVEVPAQAMSQVPAEGGLDDLGWG